MKLEKSQTAVGRPRAFNADRALEAAMRVFWRQGYEGTSLSDLTEAMGINRPSLYAAFGNKEQLFSKVVERYGAGPGCHATAALAEPTARRVAEAMIQGCINLLGNPDNPRGCLMVHAALSCSKESAEVQEDLSAKRRAAEKAMCERFDRAKEEGDLPPHVQPASLARFIHGVTGGMSVLAADGATREELAEVGRMAMLAWPGDP